MRLIVELDDEFYNHIQNDHKYFLEDGEELYSIVQNATPIPNNATNGDVINALFPEYNTFYNEETDTFGMLSLIKTFVEGTEYTDYTIFSSDWWITPYKKGGTE